MVADPASAPRSLRLRALAGSLVCQMGLGLGGYVFAVFLKPVVAELGWSRSAFAAAGGPLLLAIALASPLVGSLTERLGARTVLALGITGVAATLVGLSLVQTLPQFYLLGLLLGLFVTGLGDVPAGAVVARWFGHGRGLALGLVYVGSNIGGAIVPLVATAVADASSWRTALRVLAAGGFCVVFPAAAWLVPRDAGWRTPSGRNDTGRARAIPADPSATRPRAVRAGPPAADVGLPLAAAVRTSAFWLLGGVLAAFYFYYLGVNNHLVAYLSDLGLSDAAAARGFAATIALGIAGKLGIGAVADRMSAHRAALLVFGCMTLGSLLLLAVERVPALLPLFLVVHGATVAAENVVLPLVVAECFGTRHVAAVYGALMLALLPGGAAGGVFAGLVFDRLGTYRPAFATFAVTNVLALAALAAVRPPSSRR